MEINGRIPLVQGSVSDRTTREAAFEGVKVAVDRFQQAYGDFGVNAFYTPTSPGTSTNHFFAATPSSGHDVSDVVSHMTGYAILDSLGSAEHPLADADPAHERFGDLLARAMTTTDPDEHAALLQEARSLLGGQDYNVTK